MSAVPEAILARLRAGPLSGDEWQGLCSSRRALYTHVWALRKRGYDIRTEGRMGLPGVYHLTEPT